jgi:hypothetical protein
MRRAPNSENAAAVRVHEQCEKRMRRDATPLRREIVDMQVRDAWKREHELDGAYGEEKGGLSGAIVTPVALSQTVLLSDPDEPLPDDPRPT